MMIWQNLVPLAAIDASAIAIIVGMVISFIGWAINQASSKGKQLDQKKRQELAAQRQRQRAMQAQAQAPKQRVSQEQEVDAFLRSAAQQRQPDAQQRMQRPPAQQTASRPPRQGQTRAPQQRSVPPQIQSARPQTPQSQAPGRVGSGPAAYAGLQTSDFGESTSSMGHLEGHDHDLEQQVHAAFDHDISALDDSLAARDLDSFGDSSLLDMDLHPHAAVDSPAAADQEDTSIEGSIVEMFSNPANLRNAIIMQEVLRRPTI